MRWRGQRESENVEDRRGQRRGFGFPFPGGGMRVPSSGGGGGGRGGGSGIVGLLISLGLVVFFGVDPSVIMQGPGPGGGGTGFPDIRLPQQQPDATNFPVPGGQAQIERPKSADEDDLKKFISVVLATTEDSWTRTFRELGARYREPKLVLFSGYVRSACGTGMAAMGPFYCPADEKVYIDLDFYRELKNRFRAPGDFAQAYVVAHEVGHHVQKQLGIADKVEAAKRRIGRKEGNALQVRMELQADCLAGVWAHRMEADKGLIEPGDIDEALGAASAIGDDRIQKQTQGYVVPDSFTHGSSEQRVRWFRRGYEDGALQACDTFNTERL
ncbi:MAG: KPN_02809 family neutral zinc metallopeptidase [Methyloceanibacter sp.]|uniref:KPN_02809 family neutral zinc metallopeptidase n=1 Tax=Methyloceanibacter sp. TaxID=1965321 RepID=UPI003EE2784D